MKIKKYRYLNIFNILQEIPSSSSSSSSLLAFFPDDFLFLMTGGGMKLVSSTQSSIKYCFTGYVRPGTFGWVYWKFVNM